MSEFLAKLEKFFELPIFGPVLNLLRSRKFWAAVAGVVASMLVAQFPDLESVQTEMVTVITTLAVALIAGIAYEDGKEKSGNA